MTTMTTNPLRVPRLIALVLLTAALSACDRSGSNAAAWDRFERLPDRLQEAVTARKEFVGTLQMEPLVGSSVTVPELKRLLNESQERIAAVMEASKDLKGPAPAQPEYTEAQLLAGEHLDGIRARLMNNSRLLRADAVRCWAEGNADGAAQRLAACLRIGGVLLADKNQLAQAQGASPILGPTIMELADRIDAGLVKRLSGPVRTELAAALGGFEAPDEWAGKPYESALRRARQAVGSASPR
jgi:hypothetical protein